MSGFNWNQYKTEGTQGSDFNWDSYKTDSAEPESRSAQAAIEGFGEGATLGYLNNLQALADKPVTAIGNFLTGQDVEADDYVTARDSYNKRQQKLQQENPGAFGAGQVAGTIASSIPVAKAAQGATALARAGRSAIAGSIYGGAQNTSENEGELGGLDIGERAINAAVGGLTGAGSSLGTDALIKGVSKAGQAIGNARARVGKSLARGAEDIVENATGATRKQAENYKEGTGRYLLDKKLVGFGDSAEDIAEKTGAAIRAAENKIDSSLNALDDQGVTVSQDAVISKIQQKISALREDPSKAALVKNLEGILEDIKNVGRSEVKVSSAETTKRGFNTSSRMWDNPKGGPGKEADKIAYRAYKEAVEESAGAANPEIAKTFSAGKSEFGLLNPVVDAAEKRAKQLNQMPWGGLLDTATVVGGATQSDDPFLGTAAGLATAIARRKLSPRAASSAAVVMDRISKQLLRQPQMARLAQVDPQAFNATVFSLMEGATDDIAPSVVRSVAEKRPEKGPEKWMNDGAEKLNQAGVSTEEIELLRSTPQGRNLLIDASDANPGSVRLDSVLKRVRTAQGGTN